jgi:hypothetical protein
MTFVARGFIPGADIAGADIFVDVRAHPRPIKIAGDKFQSFRLSEMSSGESFLDYLRQVIVNA